MQVALFVSLQCLLHLKASDNELNESIDAREKRSLKKYNYVRILRQKESVAVA